MKKQSIYIGNCSKNGLYKYKFVKGKLIFCANTHDYERCTYLAKNEKIIYGVLEIEDQNNNNNGYIVSYYDDGTIKHLNKETSFGQGPCHISVSKGKRMIFVSNYNNGYFTICRINEDGSVGEKIYNDVLDAQQSHLHCSQMIDESHVCMIDLGANTIVVYEIGDSIKEVAKLHLGVGIEPRHFVSIRNKIYVVTETSCLLYEIEFKDNTLNVISCRSILPSGVDKKDNYTGCAIKLSRNKKYIYVSVRGNNSVSVFRRYKNGIKLINNVKCTGDLPRDIEIDRSDKYLFVANQNSNSISTFRRNRLNGKLKFLCDTKVESPTCIIV